MSFQYKDGCNKGADCPYDHVQIGAENAVILQRHMSAQRARSRSKSAEGGNVAEEQQSSRQQQQQPLCKLFMKGQCNLGGACPMRHDSK